MNPDEFVRMREVVMQLEACRAENEKLAVQWQEIKAENKRLCDLQNDLNVSRSQLRQARDKIPRLENELYEPPECIAQLTADLEARHTENKRLEEDNAGLQGYLDASWAREKEGVDSVKQLTADLETCQTVNKRVVGELAEWQRNYQQEFDKRKELSADLDNVKAQLVKTECELNGLIYTHGETMAGLDRALAQEEENGRQAEVYLNERNKARELARKYYRMVIDMQLRYGLGEYTLFRHGEYVPDFD